MNIGKSGGSGAGTDGRPLSISFPIDITNRSNDVGSSIVVDSVVVDSVVEEVSEVVVVEEVTSLVGVTAAGNLSPTMVVLCTKETNTAEVSGGRALLVLLLSLLVLLVMPRLLLPPLANENFPKEEGEEERIDIAREPCNALGRRVSDPLMGGGTTW